MDYIEEYPEWAEDLFEEYPDANITYHINCSYSLDDNCQSPWIMVESKIDPQDRQTWKHSKYKHGLNKFK